MLVFACEREDAQEAAAATPRAVDLDVIPDTALVAAVLEECHRPLRGLLDRVTATVRLPDGATVQAYAMLPDKLRIVEPNGSFLLLGDEVTRLGGERADATEAEAARVRRLRTLLDAALFGPLYRATGCRRTGAGIYALQQPKGPAWQLTLRPGTLLPASLGTTAGEVQFLDYLRTPSTWIVRRAELDGLGACGLLFEQPGLVWDEAFFAPQAPRAVDRRTMTVPAAGGGEAKSPDPYVVESKAARLVVLADPGAWDTRAAIYRPAHEELERQNQQIAGFPMFWEEDGRRWLGVPFRQRAGGPAFAAPNDWTIRDVPAGTWLIVYPPSGTLEERLADGERRLRGALGAQRLQADGSIVAQPFFHLHEGVPPADRLAAPTVRMSVRVR